MPTRRERAAAKNASVRSTAKKLVKKRGGTKAATNKASAAIRENKRDTGFTKYDDLSSSEKKAIQKTNSAWKEVRSAIRSENRKKRK
jgi:hypothetical protein